MPALELKAIKHSPTLSEETEAFTASIHWDGKAIGTARNHGQGGNTEVHLTREPAGLAAAAFQMAQESRADFARLYPDSVADTPSAPNLRADLEECVDWLFGRWMDGAVERKLATIAKRQCKEGRRVTLAGDAGKGFLLLSGRDMDRTRAAFRDRYPSVPVSLVFVDGVRA